MLIKALIIHFMSSVEQNDLGLPETKINLTFDMKLVTFDFFYCNVGLKSIVLTDLSLRPRRYIKKDRKIELWNNLDMGKNS